MIELTPFIFRLLVLASLACIPIMVWGSIPKKGKSS